jgi:hypothetical protein
MSECIICTNDIDTRYAVINNRGETGKYHQDCLELWLTAHRHGILTQTRIETYSIFEDDKCVSTINADEHYDAFEVFWNGINEDDDTEELEEEEDNYSFENSLLTLILFLFCCS